MTKYNIENKLVSSCSCEICGKKVISKKAELPSLNEYHKDGTIRIHYTCSNHIVDLYNKMIKEIEKENKI